MGSKKTTKARIEELRAARDALKAALPTVGEKGEPGEGLVPLINKVKTATVLDDEGVEATVTSTGRVWKGDLVTLATEIHKDGDPLRVVADGGGLLAACTMERLGDSDIPPVVFVWRQDGSTWIKTAKWTGGGWTLGPTKAMLADDDTIDRIVLVPFLTGRKYNSDSFLAALYQDGADGIIQFWRASGGGLTLELVGTDIWADDTPQNICACWSPHIVWRGKYTETWTSQLTVAYMNAKTEMKVVGIRPAWHRDAETEGNTMAAELWNPTTIVPGTYKGIKFATLTGDAENGDMPDFTVMPHDGQVYASKAWSIVGCNAAVCITYPGADGDRYLLQLYCCDYDQIANAVYDGSKEFHMQCPYMLAGCDKMVIQDYLPCGVLIEQRALNYWEPCVSGGFYGYVGAISRIHKDGQKSGLGFEIWSGGSGRTLFSFRFAEDNIKYQENIGLISAKELSFKKEIYWPTKIVVGYCAEGIYRVFCMGGCAGHVASGPLTDICAVGPGAELVSTWSGNVQEAALIYQSASGEVFLQKLEPVEVAVTTQMAEMAHGQAVTGGTSGNRIKIRKFRK